MNGVSTTTTDFEAGRSAGLATAALALSIAAFLNLLGFEKSLLAVTLAFLALRSGAAVARGRAMAALGIAAIHLVTVAAVLLLFREELGKLLAALQALS